MVVLHRSPRLIRISARICALAIMLFGATRDVALAGATPTLQFLRLHKLDNVVVPIVHPTADGGQPIAGVVQGTDGLFYGTTICGGGTTACPAGAGTVFRVSGDATAQDGSAFTVLHAFTGGADGGMPYAPLVQARDGFFYGTTNCGGGSTDCFNADSANSGHGTIFKISTTGAFATVHVFAGTTDGTSPYGALVQGRDGNLYGTTFCGGSGINCLDPLSILSGGGTIFRFNPTTGVFTTLHAFSDSGAGGCNSLSGLVEDKTTTGVFYGTMAWCGSIGGGTVFKIDTSMNPVNNLTVLHAFTGRADGAGPAGAVMIGADGSLYGTAEFGGFADGSGYGTLFKLSTTGTGFTTLYTFAGKLDGGNPYAGLIQAHDGDLYGTTFYRSIHINQTGTLFRIDPGTRQFETLYTFSGDTDGQNPSGALIQIDDSLAPGFTGSLVGTTLFGPTVFGANNAVINYGDGVIFRFAPPPLLVCPASVVTTATSTAGASVVLSATLIDPANTASTLTWKIDGSFAQLDSVPAASSLATSTRTTKSMTKTYTAGRAGTPASLHTVTIDSIDALSLTSSCLLTVEVDKRDQTINFAAVPTQTYSNPNGTVTLSAASVSGTTATNLPVVFSVVSGPGYVPPGSNILTITGAGSIVVTASQGGDGEYNPAPDVSRTITVNKANQTITFAAIPNQTFANPAPVLALTPTSSSGLAVTLTVTGPATWIQTAPSSYSLTLTGAGTVTVAASQSGDDNYNAATNVVRTFTVAKGSQTITFPPVPAQTFGNPPVTLAATASSGLAVSYIATGPGTIAGNILTITNAGIITVTASQPGNASFNAASSVSQSITVLDPNQSQGSLSRFVVFSSDLTWLHAGTMVTTGDVGANTMRRRHDDADDDDHDKDDGNQITVRLDAGVTMQQSSSRVVGDTVLLGPGSTIYNLVDNALVAHNSAVLGVRVDTMALPYLTMPGFPAIAAGVQNIAVKKNGTQTLGAGNYGRISVQSGATLILSGGVYQFVSLDVDQGGTVLFQAAIQLNIQTYLDADSRSNLILDPAASGLRASQVVVYVAGRNNGSANDKHDSVDDGFGGPAVVNIGERAVVQANIYAPNGSIWLKSRSQATGAFIGQHVLVGSFSKLTLDSAFF